MHAKVGDYFKDLSPEEIESRLMHSEDEELNIYGQFMHLLEQLVEGNQIAFGHT